MDQQSSGNAPPVAPTGPPVNLGGVGESNNSKIVSGNFYDPTIQTIPEIKAEQSGILGKIKNIIGNTRAYIPEYAVLLLVTGSLLCIINALFWGIIDYIGNPKPTGIWGGGWQYTYSLFVLASAIASIPIVLLLTYRTKGTEKDLNDIRGSSWRRGLLGVFLVIFGLTTVGYLVAFVYQVVSQMAGAGLVTANLGAWKNYIKIGFSVVLFRITTLIYARDYRQSDNEKIDSIMIWAMIHRWGLSVIAIILAIAFSNTSLAYQRGTYIDDLISNDLNSIKNKISTYESSKGKSPESLDDLSLSDEIKKRQKKYNYVYEKPSGGKYKLCADFKTDTTKKDETDSTSLESALSKSSSIYDDYDAGSSYVNTNIHSKGKHCFEYTSTRSSKSSIDIYDRNLDDFQGSSNSLSSIQSKARDTERQTDIKALHGQIEAYFAFEGKYPTLANINDANWRSTNFKGLDANALKDPNGTSNALVSAPIDGAYSYEAEPFGCNNTTADCTSYTLSAQLEAGGEYVKTALN